MEKNKCHGREIKNTKGSEILKRVVNEGLTDNNI